MTGGRRWRRLTTTAVALAALLLSGLVAAVPSSAATTTTVMLHQAPSTYVGQAFGRDAAVRLTHQSEGGVSVSAPSASIWLKPPVGEQLEAGRTYVTSSSSTRPPGVALLMPAHAGCALADVTGTVTVLELVRAADGTVSSLALDYRTECPSGPGSVGLVRWRSAIPFAATSVSTTPEPPALVGQEITVPVVLRNEGTSAEVLGASTLTPPPIGATGTGISRVAADGCAGVELAPGQDCRVDVVLGAEHPLEVRATLVTPDGSAAGASRKVLTLTVVDEPSPPTPAIVPTRGGVVVVPATGTSSQRVERSCGDGPWTVLQEEGGELVDRSLRAPQTCAFRTRTVVRDVVSEPSEPVVTGPFPVPVGNEGLFTAVTPTRVADTRDGTGVRRGRVGPGESLRVPVLGRGGVPRTGVLAVVLNVTAVAPTAGTWITAYPAAEEVPATSNLNVAAGQVRANQVVVALGPQSAVDLRNAHGSTELVVDVQGYYSAAAGPAGSGLSAVQAYRALDTRLTSGPPPPAGAVQVPLGYVDSPLAADVTITVTGASGAGFATAWSGSGGPPVASNLNFAAGQTIAAHAVVPVRTDSSGRSWITVRTAGSAAHVLVDVNGFYADEWGMRFQPADQRRLLDTRTVASPLRDGEARTVHLAGTGAVGSAVLNVTALGATSNGFLRVSSGPPWLSEVPPNISTVNFAPGEVSPVLALSRVPWAGTSVEVLARATSVHVVVDLVGTFY